MKVSEEKLHIIKIIKCEKIFKHICELSFKKKSKVFEIDVIIMSIYLKISKVSTFGKLCILAEGEFISINICKDYVIISISKEIGNDY